jgi:hypothetical protein
VVQDDVASMKKLTDKNYAGVARSHVRGSFSFRIKNDILSQKKNSKFTSSFATTTVQRYPSDYLAKK